MDWPRALRASRDAERRSRPNSNSSSAKLARPVPCRGQPHVRNLDRWESLLERDDVPGLHRVLTGLDRDSIEMREVSPMGGLLPDEERTQALQAAT